MKRFLLSACLLAFFYGCQSEPKKLGVKSIEAQQLPVDQSIENNASIDSFIKPYAKRIEDEMNSVLAYNVADLSKKDARYNTAIGNMEADAVMEMLSPIFASRMNEKIDGVLLNFGGIRSSISKGDVTTQTAYNIMPFENEAVIVKLNADAMRELFQYLAKTQTAHPISGMQLQLNADGSIHKALVQGKPLSDEQTYYIATNDYLQQGGDHMDFLAKTDTVIRMDYKLRNLFIDYFKKVDTLAPKRDDRFTKLGE